MAIKKPIPITFNLDSRQSVQSVCAVIHIDDKNTETLDLSLMQGGEHIAVSPNSTVTARFVRVKDKILISDNVPCAVQENGNIYIPIDNAAAHMLVGEIKIEINIVDENDILTMQFPLVIKVNNTILADAEISPESEGTIPELLEEAREAAESATQAAEAATKAISAKQDKLTAGQNITITEENVISASSGSNDYTDLTNKPSINNVTLSGNKSSDDLNLQGKLTAGNNITIDEDNVISAEGGGATSYNDLTDKPTIDGYTIGNLQVSHRGLDYTQLGGYGSLSVDCERVLNRLSSLSDSIYNAPSIFGFQNQDLRPIQLPNDAIGVIFQFRNDRNFQDEYGQYKTQILQHKIFFSTETGEMFLKLDSEISGEETNIGQWRRVGGAQIVSGIVNANGTITFTDSEGNSFTTSGESVIGADGFSPVATVTQTASGATITVTDKNGTTTANITNGQDGNDYVLTAQDKSDIANIVLGELPTTEGVLYGNQSN